MTKPKLRLTVWGFKHKKSGIVLIGHDRLPIVNHTKEETRTQCNRVYRPVKIMIMEV